MEERRGRRGSSGSGRRSKKEVEADVEGGDEGRSTEGWE